METFAEGISTYYLKIPKQFKTRLWNLLSFKQVVVAENSDWIWLSGMQSSDLLNPLFNSLPHRIWYREIQGKIYQSGKFIHESLPKNLEFIPLQDLFAEDLQWNVFESELFCQELDNPLLPSIDEQPCNWMLVEKEPLEESLLKYSEIRLSYLSGIQINNQFLLQGFPLLPIPGKCFWQYQDLIIPAGFNFKWPFLMDTMSQKFSLSGKNWVFFDENSNWFAVPKIDLVKLHRKIFVE